MIERQRNGVLTSLLLFTFASGASTGFANTITVTNTNDGGAGSLREAIADALPGDTIDFAVTGTIVTTGLEIAKSLTVSGPGASNLTISGSQLVQVFRVSGAVVTISGVSIVDGSGVDGGCIINYGRLTLSDTKLSGNSASSGGAIYNNGTLTISNSTLSGNSSAGGYGGAIYNGGVLTVSNSTLSGNSSSVGGGIFNSSGTLTVRNSTLSGNSGGLFGGGIANNNGTLTASNITVSGNSALSGGGIFNVGAGTLGTLSNSTLWGNSASYGGGIFMGTSNALQMKNTIIASSPSGENCSGTVISQGYNISDDNSCSSFLTQSGDLNNTPAGLDSSGLQANGGPTRTIALLATSPAVDAIPVSPANYCTAADGTPVTTDQRGIARPQGSACDIGAFELGSRAGFTPSGTSVSVQPTDTTTGGTPVTLTFATVIQAGITALYTTAGGPPLPTGFMLAPVYYNLTTNAVFLQSVKVCVNFAGTNFGSSRPRLLQYQNNAWDDVTISLDGTTKTICGSVTSLSQLAIAGSTAVAVSNVGVFRSGFFWLLDVDGDEQWNNLPDLSFPFGGVPGDIPITGDWNGDGHSKVGIYRPSNGLFILDANGDGQFDTGDAIYNLGVGTQAGDVPVVGDWNGDGRTKVGLFRQGVSWMLDTNGDGVFEPGVDQTFAFGGVAGDVPVVGDWTGTGISKIGVFRLGFYWVLDANGNGTLDNINGSGGDQAFPFGGASGDVPVIGDWNGSGTSKVGVFRQGFFWVLDANGNHTFDGTGPGQDLAFPFGGIGGDVPLVGKWY